jgi:hypothetical protein
VRRLFELFRTFIPVGERRDDRMELDNMPKKTFTPEQIAAS